MPIIRISTKVHYVLIDGSFKKQREQKVFATWAMEVVWQKVEEEEDYKGFACMSEVSTTDLRHIFIRFHHIHKHFWCEIKKLHINFQ